MNTQVSQHTKIEYRPGPNSIALCRGNQRSKFEERAPSQVVHVFSSPLKYFDSPKLAVRSRSSSAHACALVVRACKCAVDVALERKGRTRVHCAHYYSEVIHARDVTASLHGSVGSSPATILQIDRDCRRACDARSGCECQHALCVDLRKPRE